MKLSKFGVSLGTKAFGVYSRAVVGGSSRRIPGINF